jgi:hypothetical protein
VSGRPRYEHVVEEGCYRYRFVSRHRRGDCPATLSADGFAVVVNYAGSAGAATTLVQEIESAGGQAIAVQADVRDPKAVQRLFDALRPLSAASMSW